MDRRRAPGALRPDGRAARAAPACFAHRRDPGLGTRRSAVRVVPPVPARGPFRIQQDDTGAVPCRSGQGRIARRRARRAAPCRGARAHGLGGPLVVALCLVRVGRLSGAHAAVLPDLHRAPVQQVRASGRPVVTRAHRCPSRSLRIRSQGRVRDGWQPALGPRQRLLLGDWRCQAHRLL